MPPDLVIANNPADTYPGYVVAVKCAEWVAAGSGATTEIDPLACTGEAVRETQQVSGILANPVTAYGNADDTLEITNPPLNPDLTYDVYVSYRFEGYLDTTNGPLLRAATQETWVSAGVVGMHGGNRVEGNPIYEYRNPPELPYYRTSQLIGTIRLATPGPLYLRAFSEPGTTIEILVDQVVFIPVSPITYDRTVFGSDGVFAFVPVIDGADGGDDGGKFTLTPDTPSFAIANHEADYQRKEDVSDAEWFLRINVEDAIGMWGGDVPQGPAWMYSQHTAAYKGERTWTDDTFDNRTTSPGPGAYDWGISPEGYGYAIATSVSAGSPNQGYVSGGVGILKIGHPLGQISVQGGGPNQGTSGVQNQGIEIQLWDQWEWSGVWQVTLDNGSGDAYVDHIPFNSNHPNVQIGSVSFSWVAGIWFLSLPDGSSIPHDVTSWYSVGTKVGFRLEVKRFVVRWRFWDADTSEPGTWDEEYYMTLAGAGDDEYDYDDNLLKTRLVTRPFNGLTLRFQETITGSLVYPHELTVHNLTLEHDPYGDPEDMAVEVEQPEGDPVGEIVVPYGATYFVYWGKRVWWEYDAGDDAYYLVFSARAWNDIDAALQQRAEIAFFRFWWLPDVFTLIPMNWRSSDRSPVNRRVLVGD